MTEPSIPLAGPAIKPRHGGRRPGAGRKPRPCSSCGATDSWVTVAGNRRLCPCDGTLRLAFEFRNALAGHARRFPGTTSSTVRLACSIVAAEAAATLPAGQPSRGRRR